MAAFCCLLQLARLREPVSYMCTVLAHPNSKQTDKSGLKAVQSECPCVDHVCTFDVADVLVSSKGGQKITYAEQVAS